MTPNATPTPDDLRTEYETAQDSAQHHDNLVWSVTEIMWGASLLLMGFILQAINEAPLRPLITVLSILGIAFTISVWIFALQFNSVKRQKYARCKEIEALLGLRQHSTLTWAPGSQRILYGLLMALFIIAWLAVLWTTWCRAGTADSGSGARVRKEYRRRNSEN